MRKSRKQYTPTEKAAILREHLNSPHASLSEARGPKAAMGRLIS
jgi:hypothetical protein